MSAKRTLVAAALMALGAPALSQDGKALVDATCNACHPLTARIGTGYDERGWNTVMRMMINHGAPVAAENAQPMLDYLIKTYPVKGRPNAAVVDGPMKVSMKAWQVATPGSRPHDPMAAKDGSLWYSGQMAGVLGRVDPKSGMRAGPGSGGFLEVFKSGTAPPDNYSVIGVADADGRMP